MCAPCSPGQGPVCKYVLLINFCLESVCFKLGVKLLVGSLTGQRRLSTLYGQHCPFRHQILWVNFRVMTTRNYRIFVLESSSCLLLSGGFLRHNVCSSSNLQIELKTLCSPPDRGIIYVFATLSPHNILFLFTGPFSTTKLIWDSSFFTPVNIKRLFPGM